MLAVDHCVRFSPRVPLRSAGVLMGEVVVLFFRGALDVRGLRLLREACKEGAWALSTFSCREPLILISDCSSQGKPVLGDERPKNDLAHNETQSRPDARNEKCLVFLGSS